MSRREVPRAGLLKAVLAGQVTNPQVATALHLSVRQVQRLERGFAAEAPRPAPEHLSAFNEVVVSRIGSCLTTCR